MVLFAPALEIEIGRVAEPLLPAQLALQALAGMAQQVAAACAEMGTGNAADNFAAIRKVLNEDLNKVAAQLSPLTNKS